MSLEVRGTRFECHYAKCKLEFGSGQVRSAGDLGVRMRTKFRVQASRVSLTVYRCGILSERISRNEEEGKTFVALSKGLQVCGIIKDSKRMAFIFASKQK